MNYTPPTLSLSLPLSLPLSLHRPTMFPDPPRLARWT